MTDAVICEPPRTPVGGFGGSLRDVPAHQLAAAAGRFADEIVPVTVTGRNGDVVDSDEHIRPDSTVEGLARLRPILGRDDPAATVTAGNASGQNDGAAICVVTTPETAARLGLRPLARPVSWGVLAPVVERVVA